MTRAETAGADGAARNATARPRSASTRDQDAEALTGRFYEGVSVAQPGEAVGDVPEAFRIVTAAIAGRAPGATAGAAADRGPAGGRAGTPPTMPMRERIIDAATELFYRQGLRAVSADKIVAQVGITKVTFYRYFPTKDDLIVAYLERRAQWERDAVAGARQAAGDVPEVFRIVAAAIGAESCSPGFRGCPFINAAAEYADPDHPVRRVVDAHRRWFKSTIRELLDEMHVPGSDRVADQLVMLRDGAMVSGYLSDPRTVADALYTAGRAVIQLSLAS